MVTLKQARRLVARIETAQRTGTGDIRSNEVIGQLLAIAKLWIAEQPKNGIDSVLSTDEMPHRSIVDVIPGQN